MSEAYANVYLDKLDRLMSEVIELKTLAGVVAKDD